MNCACSHRSPLRVTGSKMSEISGDELVVSSFIRIRLDKPSSPYCDVIFLVRLQGNFDIDHSWE